MAFDQQTRNRLQRFVADARKLLREEFIRQLQHKYGMDPKSGAITALEKLPQLDDSRRQTATILRTTFGHYQAREPQAKAGAVLDRIVREQAFTTLNRLCAIRMAEARGFIVESVGNGANSKGFQLYARLAGTALGETPDAYRCYLFSLFDELAVDLPVLFDRYSLQGRLFPHNTVLAELLELMNHPDISQLWAEDETIGWVYQYFNSKEERQKMRKESQAPRNSRELAVRNQFFTPRYVVEFLVDNTLGRTWHEMNQGGTALKEQCRYLVRRPHEIFLKDGENPPEKTKEEQEAEKELSQEELLKQPVHIAFRKRKDPREILLLDPACGSMHFGLYAFDLYERIYAEAWDLEQSGADFVRSEELKPLTETYESKDTLLRDVPRLIIEHNIHGIDIDPRAVQIAGLSLWLRAQRSWDDAKVKAADRPLITKSNVVCAEPMPGEKDLLQEFVSRQKYKVLGQVVEIVFEKMKLAGEAGALLKIEEEIRGAVDKGYEEFKKELERRRTPIQEELIPNMVREQPKQMGLFDFSDMGTKTRFWDTAEERILAALKEYAELAEGEGAARKRMFARDAARGFAFIDVCRKRYDVVVMNPPFADAGAFMRLE